MYHQAPSACEGASSGSCYGQWILRHRSWKKLPSLAIANLVAQEEAAHVSGVSGTVSGHGIGPAAVVSSTDRQTRESSAKAKKETSVKKEIAGKRETAGYVSKDVYVFK